MAGEADGPDFEWLTKAILYLESPRTARHAGKGAPVEDDIRRLLVSTIEIQTSALSVEDKRRLATMVLQEGARQSSAAGMDEQIRHALLSKRLAALGLIVLPDGVEAWLISLGLMKAPRTVVELHELPAGSPLSTIWDYFNQLNAVWGDDARDERKAYMFACLSEIAYLYMTDRELEQDSRLRLYVPSQAGQLLHRHHARFTLAALGRAADLGDIRVIQSRRFAFFVLRIRDMVVITVRGTVMTDWRDWFADLNALKIAAPQGFYHRGFFDEANDKLADLVDAVRGATPLYITGHSLGAAMASILCAIWTGPVKPMTPYIFSSPRFGTRSVARRLRRYAYMKEGDLVTELPPKWMGYSDEGAATTVFPNPAALGSGWKEQLWIRQKLRAHSIEQMRVTLASEVQDATFDADCYTAQIAAAIKAIRAQSDALEKGP